MASMTAAGARIRLYEGKEDAIVALGDRVTFWDGKTGTAHCWTQEGVMVVLDAPYRDARHRIMAIEAGDGDLTAVEKAPGPDLAALAAPVDYADDELPW